MGSFGDTLSDILSKLAEMLGLKPSEGRKLQLMEQKLAVNKAANVDLREQLKEEISRTQTLLLRKEEERKKATGMLKEISTDEIEEAVFSLKNKGERRTIISRNIRLIDHAREGIKRITAAKAQGVSNDKLTDLLWTWSSRCKNFRLEMAPSENWRAYPTSLEQRELLGTKGLPRLRRKLWNRMQ